MIDLPNFIASGPAILAVTPIPEGGAISGTWQGLILYISVALGLSFLCSVLEAVLLSTSVSHVEVEIQTGKRSARLMQKHKANVERPISAILTLNTIAHTVGAAGAGAEAVGIFGNEAFGLISAVLTLLILVFSEIIPKTIGATYWRPLNGFAAYTIQVLVWLLYPLVWLLEQTTRLLGTPSHGPKISRIELETMARISTRDGALGEGENRIFKNLLHLRNFHVRDIMTPRTVVMSLQQDMTVRQVVDKHPSLPYSRIPIYREGLDDSTGFVLRQDIHANLISGKPDRRLSELRREMQAIPETNAVSSVLEAFISQQTHILLVIDEYGGIAGIVTMEDAIETLLGIEITDESDLVADLRMMAEQRFERQKRLLDEMRAWEEDDEEPDPDNPTPKREVPDMSGGVRTANNNLYSLF